MLSGVASPLPAAALKAGTCSSSEEVISAVTSTMAKLFYPPGSAGAVPHPRIIVQEMAEAGVWQERLKQIIDKIRICLMRKQDCDDDRLL